MDNNTKKIMTTAMLSAIAYVACVPQIDTIYPSMSLGANFNDRIFPKNAPAQKVPVRVR